MANSHTVSLDMEPQPDTSGTEQPQPEPVGTDQPPPTPRTLNSVVDQLIHEMDTRYPDIPSSLRERFVAAVELVQQATNNAQQASSSNSSEELASTPTSSAEDGQTEQEEGTVEPVRAGGRLGGQRNRQRRVFRVQQDTTTADGEGDGTGADSSTNAVVANNPLLGGNNSEVRELIRFAQSPEAKMMASFLLSILPFVLAIGGKLLVDHLWRLSAVLLACVLFVVSNITIVNHLAVTPLTVSSCRQKCKRAFQYVKAAFGPVLWLYMTCWLLQDQGLWYPNVFFVQLPAEFATEASSICTGLWRIFVADTNAKFGGMLLKIAVGCSPWLALYNQTPLLQVCLLCCASSRRRCRLFPVIEYATQLYRFAMPASVWGAYLLSHGHNDGWFYLACNYVFISIYAGAKVWQVRHYVTRLLRSVHACVRRSAYGVTPSQQALHNAANTCAICFGPYHTPVQLSCEHMFCESCIATWLDRERTCPICRAQVSQEDNKYKDAATTCLVQIF